MSTNQPKNILVLSAQVPFTRGGAELLVDNLCAELKKEGHTVDTISIPFNALPKEQIIKQIAIWRAIDLSFYSGRKVDLVIGTKFPTYAVKHPNKVLWLIHQHRQAYELCGTRFGDFSAEPNDEALRQMIVEADEKSFSECKKIFTISQNVTKRLKRFNDVDSEVLEPPLPFVGKYRAEAKGDYILSVGRLCSIKRVDLIIGAMSRVDSSLRLKIVGSCDEPAIEEYLKGEVARHGVASRIDFLGRVEVEKLLELYANAFAVYYAPFDEDYGFVTLEALKSGKPVITASDSGSVLDFITHEKNGLVAEPNDTSIAEACNRLVEDEELYSKLQSNALVSKKNTNWSHVVDKLVS